MNHEIQTFLQENKIAYRYSGDNLEIGCILPDCPNNGEPQLYIHKETGAWICHRCDARGGSIKQLAYKSGLVKWQKPIAEEAAHLYIPPDEVEGWHKALIDTPPAINYLTNIRGFHLETIKHFMLGWKMDGEQPVITIPFFDKRETCVGYKKYYYEGGVKPKCKLEKGSKVQFYNLDKVTMDEPLIITEGEFDAISLYQYGYKNTGSVPNGASSIKGWIDDLAAPFYYLPTDNDKAGERCASDLANSLGRTKCKRVYPRLKDFNDYLQHGILKEEVERDFAKAVPMFTPPSSNLGDYVEPAIQIITDPIKRYGDSTGWQDFDSILGGWRTGEITVLTGETGNGKSAFAIANVAQWLEQGKKVLLISGEMSGEEALIKLASNKYKQFANEGMLYTYSQVYKDRLFIPNIYDDWESDSEQLPIDKLFCIIDYYIERGVDYVVIDHMHCFIRKGKSLIEDIEAFMTRCRSRVKTHPIHMLLVAQCRKKDKEKRRLTKDDLYGSSEIDHASWNIMIIHRQNEKDHLVEITMDKNRTNGTLGTCHLKFDVKTQANYWEVKKK